MHGTNTSLGAEIMTETGMDSGLDSISGAT